MSDASFATQADQELALSLAAAIRTAGYFDADNAVMKEVSLALAGHIVGRTEREGFLRVGTHSHCIFVGTARIRNSLATFERFASLMQVFADREINVITFHPGVSESELARLAVALARESARGPDGTQRRTASARCHPRERGRPLRREGCPGCRAGGSLRGRRATGREAARGRDARQADRHAPCASCDAGGRRPGPGSARSADRSHDDQGSGRATGLSLG